MPSLLWAAGCGCLFCGTAHWSGQLGCIDFLWILQGSCREFARVIVRFEKIFVGGTLGLNDLMLTSDWESKHQALEQMFRLSYLL